MRIQETMDVPRKELNWDLVLRKAKVKEFGGRNYSSFLINFFQGTNKTKAFLTFPQFRSQDWGLAS